MHPTLPIIDEAEYLRLVRRFDDLWSSASSEAGQREMRRLIVLIDHYENNRPPPAAATAKEDKPCAPRSRPSPSSLPCW